MASDILNGFDSTLGLTIQGGATSSRFNGGEFQRNLAGFLPTEEGQQSFKQTPNIDKKRTHRGTAFITDSKILTFNPVEGSFQTPLLLDDGACQSLNLACWSDALATKTITTAASTELMPATTATGTMTSSLNAAATALSSKKIYAVVSGGDIGTGTAGTITVTGTWRGAAASSEDYEDISADGTYYLGKTFSILTALTTTNFTVVSGWTTAPTIALYSVDVVQHQVTLADDAFCLGFEDNTAGAEVKRVDDIMVSSLEYNFTPDNHITMSVNGTGRKVTELTAEDTAAYTTQDKLGWANTNIKFGSTLATVATDDEVMDAKLTITRALDSGHYSPGSQYVSSINPNIVDVALTVTRVLNSTSQGNIDYLNAHTTRAAQIVVTGGNIKTGYDRTMTIDLPELKVEGEPLSTTTMGQQTITTTYFARYNTTAAYTARLTFVAGTWFSYGSIPLVKNGSGYYTTDSLNAQDWTKSGQAVGDYSRNTANYYTGNTTSIAAVDDAGGDYEGVYQNVAANNTNITATLMRNAEIYATGYVKGATNHDAVVYLADGAGAEVAITIASVTTGFTALSGYYAVNRSATQMYVYLLGATESAATTGTAYYSNIECRLFI